MPYALKEIYFTLQGEGAQVGRAAVFARFVGCNLWSGLEKDRETAPCWFCDTDFLGTDGPGGGRFGSAVVLAERLRHVWSEVVEDEAGARPYVVFTGGEPMLQLDGALLDACHAVGLEVGVETNGTIAVLPGVDWVCVSPKPGGELVQLSGHELKLVFPHQVQPETVAGLAFNHFFLQPLDGPDVAASTAAAVDYCRRHPRWRMSLQTHKILRIP